jgi:hypothetical protein
MNRAGNDFFQWMRRVLPRTWDWVTVVVLCLVLRPGFELFVRLGWAEATPFKPHHLVILVFAVYYGACRATLNHPIFNAATRAWLRTVPWTPERAIPFRLDSPSGQDLLIVGLSMALGLDGPDGLPWCILSAYLLSYSGGTL